MYKPQAKPPEQTPQPTAKTPSRLTWAQVQEQQRLFHGDSPNTKRRCFLGQKKPAG